MGKILHMTTLLSRSSIIFKGTPEGLRRRRGRKWKKEERRRKKKKKEEEERS